MIFRQLFDQETWTYTYILADAMTHEAVIIDPVLEKVDRDVQVIMDLGVYLTYAFETHVHADHVTSSGALRARLNARTVVSTRSGIRCADVLADDGSEYRFGRYTVRAMATPGHTNGCLTYVVRDGHRTFAFTGDALLVRGCGRTDFQQGDARTLYRSVRNKIFRLPAHTLIYPAHDYRGHTVSTVEEEVRCNPRLRDGVTEDEFVKIMDGLNLSDPRQMDVAVPANLACGLPS